MFLQNFWSDWIELDLINCVTYDLHMNLTSFLWCVKERSSHQRKKRLFGKFCGQRKFQLDCYIYVVALFITEEVSKLQKW